MKKNVVDINTDFIKLDSFLKYSGACETGGHAKEVIANGEVKVNGNIELQRGKKITDKMIVEYDGEEYLVSKV